VATQSLSDQEFSQDTTFSLQDIYKDFNAQMEQKVQEIYDLRSNLLAKEFEVSKQ
jgi:hypothetical protein